MYTRISILVIFSALAVNCYGDTIKIVPELPELLILEGDSLELNCMHEYNSDTNTEMAVFIKEKQVITLDNTDGYVITTKTTVEDPAQNLKRTTKTLKKNITSQSDHGSFSCAVGSSLSIAIEVRIITCK
ncbi:uncharacterized protein LOC128226880 [Mya arenaria]|uniref:uncharacterized protein LOC128226880 n=1 Tax=Mya arenaria TaxID=6604 RepID=UPI0022E5787C|nr:uncharacterized protein LOC128226880 [Mya arenaria]